MRVRAWLEIGARLLACPRRRILGGEGGATAVEYGIIAAGIAVVIVAATSAIGVDLNEMFENVVEGFGGKCC